jgi:hypothetical protein
MKARRAWRVALVMVIGLALLGGCLRSNDEGATSGGGGSSGPSAAIPAGTSFDVRLTTRLSSETANVGDAWTGVVANPVSIGPRQAVAAGTTVHGVVTAAQGARRGSRAMLELAVQEVAVGGRNRRVDATTEAVIAGSPRARNLGAIAGGAAAGALIGKAIGGDGKDAAVGGLIGGAAATGLVAASKGYQVVLKPGTVMTFTVSSRS